MTYSLFLLQCFSHGALHLFHETYQQQERTSAHSLREFKYYIILLNMNYCNWATSVSEYTMNDKVADCSAFLLSTLRAPWTRINSIRSYPSERLPFVWDISFTSFPQSFQWLCPVSNISKCARLNVDWNSYFTTGYKNCNSLHAEINMVVKF